MMDLVISPLIVLGSIALVGFLAFVLNYSKAVNEIPKSVYAETPISWVWSSTIVVAGGWIAWLTDWHLTGISVTVVGLALLTPAFLVANRNWRLRRELERAEDIYNRALDGEFDEVYTEAEEDDREDHRQI